MENDWIYRRLAFHEGCVLKPYKCPKGKLTIGVGHNIEARSFTQEEEKALGDWKHGITKNAAFMLLRNDVAIVREGLKSKVKFFDDLPAERKYALIDMGFQLGIEGLLKFRKMLAAMRDKNWVGASVECLNSEYAKQTPIRARRIAFLIKTGEWITDKDFFKDKK